MISRYTALRTLAFVVAVAGVGIVVEFSLRLAQPELDPTRHLRFEKTGEDGPTLGPKNAIQRQIKNTGDFDVTVRFNKYGLRDTKDLARSNSEDYFLVGDSFTFGWGVEEEERLSERLESLIGRRVFNLSAPADLRGYEQMIAYAVRNGASASNVIIAVNIATDIIRYDRQPVDDPPAAGIGVRNPVLLARVKTFLTSNSALYLLITTLVHRSPRLRDLAAKAGLLVPNLEGIHRHGFSEDAIASTAGVLAEFARRYEAIVVIIPSRALWYGNNREVEDRRHRVFVERVVGLGLDVVDLRPEFEAGGAPLAYHFRNDGHWNRSGHAKVARVVAAHIAETAK